MYFAIDVGGTSIRVAGAPSLTKPQLAGKTNFQNRPEYADDERQIINVIRDFGEPVDGIGISAPDRLNDDRTVITAATNLPHWVGQPVVRNLSKALACPVMMNHDAYCAALGEAMYGDTKGDFSFIIYGTGIGLAQVKPRAGKVIVQRDTPEDSSDYLEPWEADCGGRNIEREFGKPPASFTEAEWEAVTEKFSEHLLRFIKHFAPETVVFGGGIAVKQWARLRAALKKSEPGLGVELKVTALGEDAGLFGALGLLRETGDSRGKS